jgi:hypothetical protein
MSLLDFVSLLEEPEDIEPDVAPAPDFVSVEDEAAPEPVAGDVAELPVVGLAAGDDDDLSVLLLEVEPDAPTEPDAPGEVVSVLELGLEDGAFVSGVLFVSAPGLAGVFVSALEPLPPLAPLLAPPAPLVCASADVASIAPATVRAKALIHVFIITILLMLSVNVVRRAAQLA